MERSRLYRAEFMKRNNIKVADDVVEVEGEESASGLSEEVC